MNIPEILVANGTGAVLVSFLLLLRVRGESKNSVEKYLEELDQRMYAEKRAFHAARDGHAAPEQGNAPSI